MPTSIPNANQLARISLTFNGDPAYLEAGRLGENEFAALRRQTEVAHRAYVHQNRPLVFSLLDTAGSSPAWALAFDTFDAFVVSERYLARLQLAARYAAYSILTVTANKPDLLSHSLAQAIGVAASSQALLAKWLVMGALTHIAGHEFGHFTRGHLGAGNVPVQTLKEAAAVINRATQAFEFDADVQAIFWSISRLDGAVKSSNIAFHDPNDEALMTWLREADARQDFFLANALLLMFGTLGRSELMHRNEGGKTHPSGAFRAHAALLAHDLVRAYPQHSDAATGLRAAHNEARIVTATWLALLVALKASKQDPELSIAEREFGLAYPGIPSIKKLEAAITFYGMAPLSPAHTKVANRYVRMLTYFWSKYEAGYFRPNRRWPDGNLFNWRT